MLFMSAKAGGAIPAVDGRVVAATAATLIVPSFDIASTLGSRQYVQRQSVESQKLRQE
jgi:hypothetical protein